MFYSFYIVKLYCKNIERVYINGKFSAFQANDMGSIPITRLLFTFQKLSNFCNLKNVDYF